MQETISEETSSVGGSQRVLGIESLTMEDVREIARGRVLLRARNTRLEGSDSDKADAYENLEESLESMQEDVEYALERIDLSGRRIDRLKEERRRNTESVSLIRLEDQHETLLVCDYFICTILRLIGWYDSENSRGRRISFLMLLVFDGSINLFMPSHSDAYSRPPFLHRISWTLRSQLDYTLIGPGCYE